MSSTNIVPMQVMVGEGTKFPWPRRASIPNLIPAEKLLKDAIWAVDCLPGNTTEIVIALQKQFDLLADFVESNGLIAPEGDHQ